jgi:hypothetical protein
MGHLFRIRIVHKDFYDKSDAAYIKHKLCAPYEIRQTGIKKSFRCC